MKVVILTQNDYFFIPANIEKIISFKDADVALIAVINMEGSLMNRKWVFVKGYGLFQALKMGMLLYKRKIENLLDAVFHYRLLKSKRSIKAAAVRHHVPFHVIGDPNNKGFVDQLKEIAPDVIVSLSAPCVFDRPIRSIPPLGCINLHCSRLPYYQGLMPNFWALFNKEERAGATVHFMDDRIDNGEIICQEELDIFPDTTMFDLIKRTKDLGGELLLRALEKLKTRDFKVEDNRTDGGSYYSWPSLEQMKEFRGNGGRFI